MSNRAFIATLTAICAMCTVYASVCSARSTKTDSLLLSLDTVIAQKSFHTGLREKSIALLRRQLTGDSSHEKQFEIEGLLFENLKNYQLDSAYRYATRRVQTARLIDDPRYVVEAQLNVAEATIMSGMYHEAFEILDEYAPQARRNGMHRQLYHTFHALYLLMFENSLSAGKQQEYSRMTYLYKDSILTRYRPGEAAWALVMAPKLIMEHRYDRALELASEAFLRGDTGQGERAILANIIADVYRRTGQRDMEEQYLAISSLYDLRAGNKEYVSLRKLAVMLYYDGDLQRAYDYMKCAMDDALFCNARIRTLEIARMQPIINDAYGALERQGRKRMQNLLLLISVVSAVLVASLVYIHTQFRALSGARRKLALANRELSAINERLSTLNALLGESNTVKKEYIGYLFGMCSAYIDKLEDFRKNANRKLKAGQQKELAALTGSTELLESELREFYVHCDTVFLSIYPDFVADFNSLLRPGEAIVPREGELMSPELRIFALVKLGFNDSVKIASFLRYSPQTVYNYRLRVRNKALGDKGGFDEMVRQIGEIKP